MIDHFMATYRRLLQEIHFQHHRYMFEKFSIENRLTGLIGPRGTGKTTLLLQYIDEKIEDKDECIYVSLDHLYFSQNLLMDFVNKLYQEYGVRYYFLDEIHKYQNWNQELKNIYDAYPDVTIVFSGSSSMDLVKGSYDLSRRGVLFRMVGMSFREYLLFNDIAEIAVASFDDLLRNRSAIEEKVAGIKKIKGHFKEYLGGGYYPFFLEDRKTYHQKIVRVIEKTIYEDISHFYKLKTENVANFKKILSYLATIPPGELKINNIARHIGMDNKTVQHYVNILHETGLVELVAENRSGSAVLKKTEKMYLDNPDLYKAIIDEIGYELHVGTMREVFFIKMLKNSGHKVYYSKTGYFEIKNTFFEIGGKNKTRKQIKNSLDNAFLIKDNILFGNRHEIPLYLFGFLY